MKLLEVDDLTLLKDGALRGMKERGMDVRSLLDKLSFSIEAEQSVALVSDDRECLRALALVILGCSKADSGCVRFKGIALTDLQKIENRDRRRRLQAIFSASSGQLPDNLTVRQIFQEIRPLWYRRVPESEFRELVEKIFSDCRLAEEVQSHYPRELTSGELQKVALVRALITQPSLLICQGVTEGLDAVQQAELINLLASMRESLSLALLVLTDDLAVAVRLSDAIGVIDRGRLVEIGTKSEILSTSEHEFFRRLVHSSS